MRELNKNLAMIIVNLPVLTFVLIQLKLLLTIRLNLKPSLTRCFLLRLNNKSELKPLLVKKGIVFNEKPFFAKLTDLQVSHSLHLMQSKM